MTIIVTMVTIIIIIITRANIIRSPTVDNETKKAIGIDLSVARYELSC